MPYIEREVLAGDVREVRRMFTGRVHTKGAQRGPRQGKTGEAQEKANDRRAEENLRWAVNGNFGAGDLHAVLHYYRQRKAMEEAEADKREFLRLMRKECKRMGIGWKYIACTEMNKAGDIHHHHILLPPIPMEVLQEVWERVAGPGGNVSIKPLDKRGNHAKLASYLMKYTRQTAARYRAMGRRYKRFTAAQGMRRPKITYRVIPARSWKEQPRPRKGWELLKDENGEVARSGWHELTGWPWMEYTEIRTDKDRRNKHDGKSNRKNQRRDAENPG